MNIATKKREVTSISKSKNKISFGGSLAKMATISSKTIDTATTHAT